MRILLFCMLILLLDAVKGQSILGFDEGFKTFSGFDDLILDIEPTVDGGKIIGGYFTHCNRSKVVGLVKLNENNEIDTSFQSRFEEESFTLVSDIASTNDGGYFVIGDFKSYDTIETNGLIKINAFGDIDPMFNAGGIGFDSIYGLSPRKIQQLPDGKILVAGSFSKYNGMPVFKMVRLLANGSLDTTFNFGMAGGVIYDFIVLPDGSIIYGGNFVRDFADISKYDIGKVDADGEIDSAFHVAGVGLPAVTLAAVYALELTDDMSIIAGGNFSSYNGYASNEIVKINLDGSVNMGFVSSITGSGTVHEILINDGNIYFAGQSLYLYGVFCSFGVLNDDGSGNLSFPTHESSTGVYALAFDAAENILLGGSFFEFSNQVRNHYIQLHPDGEIDMIKNGFTGASNAIYDIAPNADGTCFIGGAFDLYDKYAYKWFAKLNQDGTLDTTFDTGTGFNGIIRFIQIQLDGKLLVGGDFTSYNGTTANHMIRLLPNGTIDPLYTVGSGPATYTLNTYKDVKLLPDNKLIVAGVFSSFSGIGYANLVRLFTNGTVDLGFVPPSIGSIYGVESQPDNKVIVFGGFSTVGGISKKGICRLNTNGSLDLSFNTGTGGSVVYDCALTAEGKLIIVGTFTTFNGVAVNHIARLHADGSLDTSFHIGTGASSTIDCVNVLADGKIQISGYFTSYDGFPVGRFAILNPDGSLSLPFAESAGVGFDASPEFTVVDANGDFLVSYGEMYNDYLFDYICRLKWNDCITTFDTVNTEIMEGEYYVLPNGDTVTAGGEYVVNLISASGCDSIIHTIVTIIPLPCTPPVSQSVSNITTTSAKINWTAVVPATQYNIWYRTTGGGIWMKKNATGTSKKLTGLLSGVTYEYKIRSKCTDVYSGFAGSGFFTTLPLRSDEFKTLDDVVVYPNPTSGAFTVSLPEHSGNGYIRVFDIFGRCVHYAPFTNNAQLQIDLENSQSGLYVIKIVGQDLNTSLNILVQ